jgi:hypothetical protein
MINHLIFIFINNLTHELQQANIRQSKLSLKFAFDIYSGVWSQFTLPPIAEGVRLELTTELPPLLVFKTSSSSSRIPSKLRRAKGSNLHLKLMRTVLAGQCNKPIFTCSPLSCPGKITRTHMHAAPPLVNLNAHPSPISNSHPKVRSLVSLSIRRQSKTRVMHEARTHKHPAHNGTAKPVCVTSPYVPGAGLLVRTCMRIPTRESQRVSRP